MRKRYRDVENDGPTKGRKRLLSKAIEKRAQSREQEKHTEDATRDERWNIRNFIQSIVVFTFGSGNNNEENADNGEEEEEEEARKAKMAALKKYWAVKIRQSMMNDLKDDPDYLKMNTQEKEDYLSRAFVVLKPLGKAILNNILNEHNSFSEI
jgi:hypothetical protein